MDSTVPPTKVDLSLIPLEEIIQEIFKRHHAVVVGMCIHKDLTSYQTLYRFFGHKHSCSALASALSYRINKEELDSLRPTIEQ